MGKFGPAVFIPKALESLPRDSVPGLADFRMDGTRILSIVKGREEVALSMAGGQNVYFVDWTSSGASCRLCFFGDSEHEVLDRLSVAEVMLG